MYCDLHTHSKYSDGRNPLRDNVRAAEASGLDLVAATDHCYQESPTDDIRWISDMINEVRALDEQHSVRLLAGVEAAILDCNGRVSIEPETTEQLDLVLVDLGGRTKGVAKEAPASKSLLVKNVVNAVIHACRNPVVDVIAHPFNIARITDGSLYLTDIPESAYAEIAAAFAECDVCFDVMNLLCYWFPDTPISRLTDDYVRIVSIFSAHNVRFTVGSDAHSAGAIGQTRWSERVLKLANVPDRQVFGRSSGPFRFRNGFTVTV